MRMTGTNTANFAIVIQFVVNFLKYIFDLERFQRRKNIWWLQRKVHVFY